MHLTDGVTTAEEVPSLRVVSQGVSSDRASRSNYTSQETIIQVREGSQLSNDDLQYLRSLELDEADRNEAAAQPLIRKVPSLLMENKYFQKHKYFKPKVIAIGPLHHTDPSLRTAEKLKLKRELAALFIKKLDGFDREILYSKIKMEIGSLKKCYDPKDIEDYDDEKLTRMFFLDGCAVLQAIYLRHAPDEEVAQNESNKLINIKIDFLTLAYVDFFLLENQIPYRVLDLLTSSSCDHAKRFKESIEKFIDENVVTPKEMKKQLQQQGQLPQEEEEERLWGKQQKSQQEQKPAHLLALLRARLLRETVNKGSTCCRYIRRSLIKCLDQCKRKGSHHSHTFRNVKELSAAGIWLKSSETSCLKDISFHRACFMGKLWLPPIKVDDSTGPKFMNLIAYEMCPDFNNDFDVTSYICFLDSLIDEAEDVKALRDAGILHNGLGSDQEVAKLFNKMNTDLVPNPEIYSKVQTQIQDHCNNKWIKYAAQAYHTHFTSPWTFLAFAGALAALILSSLQTYYTIHPKN